MQYSAGKPWIRTLLVHLTLKHPGPKSDWQTSEISICGKMSASSLCSRGFMGHRTPTWRPGPGFPLEHFTAATIDVFTSSVSGSDMMAHQCIYLCCRYFGKSELVPLSKTITRKKIQHTIFNILICEPWSICKVNFFTFQPNPNFQTCWWTHCCCNFIMYKLITCVIFYLPIILLKLTFQ